MDPLFTPIALELARLSDDYLAELEASYAETIAKVTESPDEFVTEERSKTALLVEMRAGVEALKNIRGEIAARLAAIEEEEIDLGAEMQTLAAETEVAATTEEADAEDEEEEEDATAEVAAAEDDEETDEETATAETAPETTSSSTTASTTAANVSAPAIVTKPKLARPARAAAAAPIETSTPTIPLTTVVPGLGHEVGEEITLADFAKMAQLRRRNFGKVRGVSEEKMPLAQFDARDLYSDDRKLGADLMTNLEKIQEVVSPYAIREEFARRIEEPDSLTASGGLCAPVTPVYSLMQMSSNERPVRAALPAFNAERGGIVSASPPTIANVTTAVGVITEAADTAGGSSAAKTCEIISCPPLRECVVDMIYHCLQFGNLNGRTFPELINTWTELTMAAHARVAESRLLSTIDTGSVQVHAGSLTLGASASFFGQLRVAAAAQRNRHRMSPDTVLRALIPRWFLDALVSDQNRTQVDRFDMTPDNFVAQIRAAGVEPSFYIDGANGKAQVFGTQAAGGLTPFPTNMTWYLFPEGSWLFLDGGTLELGVVRDSVLNATNDYQIFGETFEAACYLGIESLAITSVICDSGAVSLPKAVTCPVNYA